MPYSDSELENDVAYLTSKPEWVDEGKRPEFIRSVAERIGDKTDPQTQSKLLGALWERSKGGWVKQGVDFTGRAIGEVAKSIPASGGAVVMAAGDATGVSDSGSGTRLKRGVADLWDATGQRLKQLGAGEVLGMNLFPGESKQALRDHALEALKQNLDDGEYPPGLERWLAGGFDDGTKPDEETGKWINALTVGMAKKSVEADHMGEADPKRVRAWLESDRNPLFADSDTGGIGPREMLADYVATRDPRSWEAFLGRVKETDSQRTTRLQRFAAEPEARAVAQAMPDGLMRELVGRSQDMQTSPIDMATAVVPLFRGAAALRAVPRWWECVEGGRHGRAERSRPGSCHRIPG